MLAPDPTDWIVERTGPQVVLIAQNAIGRYVLTKPNKLLLASQYLAPAAIDRVLAASANQTEYHLCKCPTGVGLPRCYHKFCFNDIRALRAEKYTVPDWITSIVHRLELKNPLAKLANPANPANPATRTIEYYLGETHVCRRFFEVCLCLSKRLTDKISNRVRGIEIVSPPRTIPYNPKTLKVSSSSRPHPHPTVVVT